MGKSVKDLKIKQQFQTTTQVNGNKKERERQRAQDTVVLKSSNVDVLPFGSHRHLPTRDWYLQKARHPRPVLLHMF